MNQIKSIHEWNISLIDEKIESSIQALSGGRVTDYSQYKDLCGYIRGLRAAKEIIIDSAKKEQEDYDE